MIILISGKQGSGKTTLSKALMKKLEASGYTPFAVKFADAIYKMHDAVLDILQEYGIKRDIVKDGPLLQLLGTEWGRKTLGENIWATLAKNAVVDIMSMDSFDIKFPKPPAVVIDDARFENELDAFPIAFKVRLECDKDKRKARCSMWRENDSHPSETGLDAYSLSGKFDLVAYTEDDNSPEELARTIVKIASRRD